MLQEQRHPISGMAKAGRSPQQAVEAGLERWPGHSLTWVSLGEPNEGPSYAAGMTNASVVSPTAIRIRPSQRSAGRGSGGGWGERIHADLRNDTGVIVRDYPGSDLLPDLAQARKKNKSLLKLSNYSKDFEEKPKVEAVLQGEQRQVTLAMVSGEILRKGRCRRLPEAMNIHFGWRTSMTTLPEGLDTLWEEQHRLISNSPARSPEFGYGYDCRYSTGPCGREWYGLS